MNAMKLQEVHDRLIAVRPEGASCPEDCPFCSGEFAFEVKQGGNHVSEQTYTAEEVEALVTAAVAKATAALQTELDEFKSSQETAEVEAKIAAAREEMEAQISELTLKLDEAVIEAQQAKQERDEVTAWLTAEAERIAQEAEAAARLEERIARVAEVVTFPEEYVAERADRWSALDDEEFEALLADYKTLSEKSKSSESPLPAATAMVAARVTGDDNGKVGSALKDLIRGRQFGIDPRSVR